MAGTRQSEDKTQLLVACSAGGFCVLPILMVAYELAVAQTTLLGVGEGMSCGLINSLANSLGFIYVRNFSTAEGGSTGGLLSALGGLLSRVSRATQSVRRHLFAAPRVDAPRSMRGRWGVSRRARGRVSAQPDGRARGAPLASGRVVV